MRNKPIWYLNILGYQAPAIIPVPIKKQVEFVVDVPTQKWIRSKNETSTVTLERPDEIPKNSMEVVEYGVSEKSVMTSRHIQELQKRNISIEKGIVIFPYWVRQDNWMKAYSENKLKGFGQSVIKAAYAAFNAAQ